MIETESILNPQYQHLYHTLAYRAMNPGLQIPEVAEHIRALMTPPEEIAEKAKKALKDINRLFPREEIVKKKEKVTGDSMFAKKR